MTPHYKIVEIGGKELVIFYPQFKGDDGYKIIDKDNRFPIELKNHAEYTSFLETLVEREQELKDGLTTLADLVEEMNVLAKGPKGDTRFMWVKYADDAEGNGMSDNPDGKKFIGMAFNKDVEKPSDEPSDYKFVKYVADYDGLEIGGRNLLRNSEEEHVKDSSVNSLTYLEIVDGLLSGEEYTLSFEAKSTNGTDNFYISTNVRRGSTYQRIFDLVPSENYARYSYTFVAQEGSEDVVEIMINNRILNNPNNTGYLYIKKLKLEKGTVATDWSPAPEDVYALIDDIDAEHVGLGNVQNYGIALESQAKAGVSNATYMTPLRTKQAIDAQRPITIPRLSADTPGDNYPLGLSFMDIDGGGVSDGYPQNYGYVMTYKTHDRRMSQEFVGNGYNETQETRYMRYYHDNNDYDGWTPWQQAVYVDIEIGDDYMVKRFADGTMELSGMQEFNNVSYNSAGAIYRSGGLSVDYPVEFADDNVCVTLSSSSSRHWVDMSGNGSATGFPFRSFSYDSGNLNFTVRYQATGRWR